MADDQQGPPRVTVDRAKVSAPRVAPRHPDLTPICNADELGDHGLAELRLVALDVIAAGLRAADPGRAVDRLVRVDASGLHVSGRTYDLGAARSVVVLGAGKASLPIVAALERQLGALITRGLVVRRAGEAGQLHRVEVIDADHPVPAAASLVAGQRLIDLAGECGPGDVLITAFTGGSSALACLPPEGVSFEAKCALHSLLLDSGASIDEVNAVRKHVSAIKGGRLAARAAGATIVNLTVSDVIGDAVDLLCDAAVQDTTSPADAIAVLERYDLWEAVEPQIRHHLGSDAAWSPSLAGADIVTSVLVSGTSVVDHMADHARAIGWTPVVLGSALAGDGASLGGFLGALAAESSARGRPFAPGDLLISAGGEATVSIRRGAGKPVGSGGPNQEIALGFAAATAVKGAHVAGAFVDSDGSDGGTEAAGACVDSMSVASAAGLRIDLARALTDHDSMGALERLGDLVMTGPTGTNISDLIAIAIGHPPRHAGDVALAGPAQGTAT